MGTERYEQRRPAGLFLEALRLSGKDRPRVLFVMTATGDMPNYLAMSYHCLLYTSDAADE